MTGKDEGRAGIKPCGALLLLMGLTLAGCDRLGILSVEEADVPPARAEGTAALDVEAPEVFQVAEPGLWDGRPSLGGLWVAHPNVTDPERVRIVNQTNGQEVVGALFRRERDLPGPALQVSSDAAEALGMLAGAPADLEVTALRRPEETPAPVAEAEPTSVEAAEPAAEPTQADQVQVLAGG